jgi:hypothetical protein
MIEDIGKEMIRDTPTPTPTRQKALEAGESPDTSSRASRNRQSQKNDRMSFGFGRLGFHFSLDFWAALTMTVA